MQCSNTSLLLNNKAFPTFSALFVRGIVATDVNRRALIVLDLDTNITKTITDSWHDTPRGIAINEDTSEVFWVDAGHKSISKACISMPCYKKVISFYEGGMQKSKMTMFKYYLNIKQFKLWHHKAVLCIMTLSFDSIFEL